MWHGRALDEPSYGAIGFVGQIIIVLHASFWRNKERREVQTMQALKTHVAGVDVHKEILAITVLLGAADAEPEALELECSTFTESQSSTSGVRLGLR